MTVDLWERLRQSGENYLNDAELLAILLQVGTPEEETLVLAGRLLQKAGNLRRLSRWQYADWLLEVRPQQAARITASFELGRRLAQAADDARPVIRTARDVANLLALEMERHTQEHLCTVLLDVQRQVLAIHTVYIGSVDTTLVRTPEVFREAVARNATALILVHNHPSGNPAPSPQDLELTEHLSQAGRLLDIAVLDHVIIGHDKWISLQEAGFL